MNSPLQHTLIRASAGTGKTYQLVNRYVGLLLLQSQHGQKIAPEKIVAVTFTRKGAGEFIERILHQLATDPGSKDALGVVVDQFDRLMLGTIDSFMARSVQTLAFELGLGGFQILEGAEVERQRQQLMGDVLRAVGQENLETFYQTLKRATLKSASNLDVVLDRFVMSYHGLLHALPDAPAWGGAAFWNGAPPSEPEFRWRDEAAALRAEIETMDFGHKNVNKGLTGALTWLESRTPGTRSGTLPTWLQAEGLLAGTWNDWPAGPWEFDYARKTITLPAALMKKLQPIFQAWLAAECAALSQKTASIYTIVNDYERLYDVLARRRGRLAFDDLPRLLDETKGGEAVAGLLQLLSYRWYQQFDHWLLDEFQDTSRVQWEVLKPWLDEAIQDNSGTKSVFVVGDPKQSIYGWRGGEPRLFDDLTRSYPARFHETVMAESWRSRPSVLELVNRICDPARNPSLHNAELFSPMALERWKYDRHIAEKSKRQSQPGYAAVLFARDEDDAGIGDGEEEIADHLAPQARAIKDVLERIRPVERGMSCAILVRKNKNAQTIAHWLRTHGVPQVMVEGVATLAEQSPVVAAVVDALRWLSAPADTFAAGHVMLSPLGDVLKRPAGAVWRHWRDRIAEVGAPQVTHEWCEELIQTQRDPHTRYCLQHVSQTAQLSGASLRLPDWLAALEQLTVNETAAAGAVHVMTIHKAKGLGFDVVFLPDLDFGSGGQEDVLIRRDARGQATGCLAYPPQWLQAWEARLGDACRQQKADQDLEALCVLYVALTRAKEATYLILNEKKPRGASRMREWILSAVPEGVPWTCGAEDFAEHKAATAASPEEPVEIRLLPPTLRQKRRRPSEIGHTTSLLPVSGTSDGREFGVAVHEVFEQMEWWTPEQELRGSEGAVAAVRRCMEAAEIRAMFTSESDRDEALRELPMEFMEHGIWWSGVIDRLVVRRGPDGSIRKALLIDFKTDRVDSAEELRTRYAEQLGVYRKAVMAALSLTDEQIEVCLLSTHLRSLYRFAS
jgi:ATP-dependent exoDNAse (exonuclease V) beta subunit